MHNIPGAAFSAQAVRKFQNEFNDLMLVHVRHLQGLIVQNSVTVDGKTIVPRSAQQRLLTDAGNYVQRIFVGSDYRSAYASDGVTPLADYPKLLNKWLVWVTYKVVDSHAKYMARALPDDIKQWLNNRVAVEMVGGNPLAVYSAPHTWVDPRGYRLSDRIWGVSVRTRTQIDNLLLEGINTGRSSLDIAKDLEQFLLPNRKPFRTRRPYGSDASFDAMRLARSEITRAHSYASFAAATANPFVDGWDFALSAQHPKIDICDTLATIGMGGERLKDPYPLDGGDVPIPVQDTHPQCICTGRPAVIRSRKEIIDQLRTMMGQGDDAPITPINVYNFLKVLLGAYLANLIFTEILQQLGVQP